MFHSFSAIDLLLIIAHKSSRSIRTRGWLERGGGGLPILLGLQQFPVAADLQLQGQLGVLQHLQFSDHLLQAVLQPGDPLHVLVILTVVFSLHVRHLALQSYDLVAQFGILFKEQDMPRA